MKTDFKFANLLGTVYCKGNLVFTPDGNSLLSPVGNRVTVFNLVQNTSYTLPLAHRRNISRLALDPRGNLLLSVDEDGQAILTHFSRRIVLYHLSFKGSVNALSFCPDGRYFAVGIGRIVEVWHTPDTPDSSANGELGFAPFVRHHRHAGHFDTVTNISWSSDSRFFLSTSKDLTARIWSLHPEDGFQPTALGGHRQTVRAAWFTDDQETLYTISKDGALFEWKFFGRPRESGPANDDAAEEDEEDLRWRISSKHYFQQNRAHLTCATYHSRTNLLISGFSSGIFMLHELPDFNLIHTLSISSQTISQVTANNTGEWLAFGSAQHGTLLVWEWQSETQVLKQAGHADSLNALAYSPDGARIVTCADDGALKVWDAASGLHIATFREHRSGVTACAFASRGNVLFTASLDGSVRAWDMVRYRNFRTFAAPERRAFASVAVDAAGEVVAAGSLDNFTICVWSVQTGALLDELSGHEGPVASLAFAPGEGGSGGALVSGSWDRTVRVWTVFARTQTSEPLQLGSDVLALAVRPDGRRLAVATLDGQLSFWSIKDAVQTGLLDARRDVSGGRRLADRRTAANVDGTKHFSCLAFSGDGSCLLAGGNSKYICLYGVETGVMLKKWTVSVNLSLDGTQEFISSRNMTEAGPRALLDTQGEASDLEDRIDTSLPGSKRGQGDASKRQTRPEVRVPALAFSPAGRAFCAASTEGLLVYSLDAGGAVQFDPFDLDVATTPAAVLEACAAAEHVKALVMAFRLADDALVRHVYERVPPPDIRLVVRAVPQLYLKPLMRFLGVATESNPHLEVNLLWIEALLSAHGRYIKDRSTGVGLGLQGESLGEELRLVQRAVHRIQAELGRLADANTYRIDYLLSQAKMRRKKKEAGDVATSTAPTAEELALALKEHQGEELDRTGLGYVNGDVMEMED